MKTTIRDFQRAAEAHLHVASASNGAGKKGEPHGVPGTIAYLACVAAECSLKCLLLKMAKVTDDAALQRQQSRLYDVLFRSAAGHSLETLAMRADVVRLLSDAAPRKGNAAWDRMCNNSRPYALRYGTESLSSSSAADELALARSLHENIKNLLGKIAR